MRGREISSSMPLWGRAWRVLGRLPAGFLGADSGATSLGVLARKAVAANTAPVEARNAPKPAMGRDGRLTKAGIVRISVSNKKSQSAAGPPASEAGARWRRRHHDGTPPEARCRTALDRPHRSSRGRQIDLVRSPSGGGGLAGETAGRDARPGQAGRRRGLAIAPSSTSAGRSSIAPARSNSPTRPRPR